MTRSSAHGLLDAFRILETEGPLGVAAAKCDGAAAIDATFQAVGDDYQRRLCWILSKRPFADAVADLIWLSEKLHGRATMYRLVSDAGTRMPPVPGAYRD